MVSTSSNQIEEGKYEHPHQVYKVPVETNFLDHLVMATLVKSAICSGNEAPNEQANARENVGAVETGDEKEQVGEQHRAVLIGR